MKIDQIPRGEVNELKCIQEPRKGIYCVMCKKGVSSSRNTTERHHILSYNLATVLIEMQIGIPATDEERKAFNKILRSCRTRKGNANLCNGKLGCHIVANERQERITDLLRSSNLYREFMETGRS